MGERCVRTDRWDREDVQVAEDLSAFRHVRSSLAAQWGAPAGEVLNDVFFALLRPDPELLPATDIDLPYRANRIVIEELLGLPATMRLRAFSVGDPFAAASAAVELHPSLDAVFDELGLVRDLLALLAALTERIDDLQSQAREAADNLDRAVDDGDLPEAHRWADELAELNEEVKDQESSLASLEDSLEDLVTDAAAGVLVVLADGADAAAEKAESSGEAARAWGVGPGTLERMNAAERFELARRLQSPRLRELADLFGRVENAAFCAPASITDHHYEEVYDVELGADLARVLPSELVLLGDERTENEFWSRLAEQELTQYAVRGEDERDRGGIVLCVDGSQSMVGDRELFAKAVMLVLLHEARRQHRPIHVLHFSSATQLQVFAFTKEADFTPERIIAAAEHFFRGGTCYETPLDEAVRILGEEHDATGATTADVFFLSDDEYYLTDEYVHAYRQEMLRLGARTYGMYITNRAKAGPGSALWDVSDSVATVRDLTSGADVAAILRRVRTR